MSIPLPRAVFATVLLSLTLSLTLVAGPAQAQTTERYEDQARAVTNQNRADRDLVRLRPGPCVQRFAERQAARMARQQRIFHQDLGVVLRRCNLYAVGENVASGADTGREVVRAWMHSAGHRRNILNPRYRVLGMAAKRGGNGQMYAAQVFGRG